jgi:hypothetical protein
MSLFVDKKYINFVSSHFQKFKWKSEKLANCRCVFCGDSEEDPNKMRGYFFTKNNTFFYKCHNCGTAFNVYTVLEKLSPSLCREYRMESEWLSSNKLEILPKLEKPVSDVPLNIQYLSDLPPTHKARVYVEGRKIPQRAWKDIGYTEDFSELAVSLNPDYNGRFYKEDRLVVVIRDRSGIIGIQGRSFSKRAKMKYITLKKKDEEMFYNLNGVDLSKTFYVTEGPFDSMFLPNALATLGVSGFKNLSSKIDDTNAVYIVDNQPKNKDVVKLMNWFVTSNKNLFVFPTHIKQKDIHDMVLDGVDVLSLLKENTYSGLKALLKFNEWKKI